MKKLFITLLLIVFSSSFLAQDTVMVELRKLYYLATISDTYIEKAEKHMSENKSYEAFGAYRAMLLFMEAKYAFNPYTKLSFFKKGRKKMEETLKLYPNNLENHFLRLAIQTKLPGFLGYHGSKKDDKEYVLKHYRSEKDWDLKARIKIFFKDSDILSTEEYKNL